MLFGGPLLAVLSQRLGNYHIICFCGLWMAAAFVFLLLSNDYHGWLLAGLFFSVGIMCCYQVIVFAAGAELVKPALLGVTIAFLNCINMLGGSFFHTIIGAVMDMYWAGDYSVDGVKLYHVEAYHAALMLIPISAIIGSLMIVGVGFKTRKS
jgi:MFS family permease